MEYKAMGTCAGTGAAINVCLGWVPDRVIVRNIGATADLPEVVWTRDMSLIAALDNGIKRTGLAAGAEARALLSDYGISVYNGGEEMVFDAVQNRWEDTSGNSVEAKHVDGHYKRSSAADAATKCFGYAEIGLSTGIPNGTKVKTVPGFTIGTDADLNVAAEQLCWEAVKY